MRYNRFRVTWSIEVSARSHVHAAKVARMLQLDTEEDNPLRTFLVEKLDADGNRDLGEDIDLRDHQ